MSINKEKHDRCVMLKQSMVDLTGGFEYALVLEKFLYWDDILEGQDRLIENENKHNPEKQEVSNGWMNVSMTKVSINTMINLPNKKVIEILASLINNGWMEKRTINREDGGTCLQCRVNKDKINTDLKELGYRSGLVADYFAAII